MKRLGLLLIMAAAGFLAGGDAIDLSQLDAAAWNPYDIAHNVAWPVHNG